MPDPIQSIIDQMTLEEKAALCTGATAWTTTPIERLVVPELIVSDGPHGLRRIPDVHAPAEKGLPATCFPTASCSAATWNVDLLRRMGEALASEAIALNVDVVLGPGVNMKRSPLCGRNFEYFSEDPYLAGELAASLIQGVQSRGVGTSLKHFAANNQEFQRFTIDAQVDERALREVYLPAFEKAVKQGKPATVMCSYNKLNGTYSSQNRFLLTELLREEWGFEGLVVSDWGAVHDRVAALQAGLDLEMPGPHEAHVKAVVEAVRSGELGERILDQSVRRILQTLFKARETPKSGSLDVEAHHALARDIAAEGMVLLKNNGLLPLKGQKRIAVIGASAKEAHFQGGGSSHITPTRVTQPFEALAALAVEAELTYAPGYAPEDTFRQDLIDEAVARARQAEVALLFVALPASIESEGYDRTCLDLTPQQEALIQAVAEAQPNSVVILNNGAPVRMSPWLDGVAAVLEGYLMGQAGGLAIADILFGRVNPSGKLAETFPLRLEDTPAFLNWPGEAGRVRYGEGLFIGYRAYDARRQPVLFPFGYGLSYTTFRYDHARVSAEKFQDTAGVIVSVDVTNTGPLAGKETVQLYVHPHRSRLVRPEKELKGFAKVALQPGETQTVYLPLDFRAFAYYHPAYRQWVTESGEFDLLIAASAADIRQTLTVTLESTLKLPSLLTRESTVAEWLDDPLGRQVITPLIESVERETRRLFEEGADVVDPLKWAQDMPLESVLNFLRSIITLDVEDTLGRMLEGLRRLTG